MWPGPWAGVPFRNGWLSPRSLSTGRVLTGHGAARFTAASSGVHPLLTDLTLGCWISASILDVAGGSQTRSSATLLVGAGLAAAGPTALAGTGDWAEMTGTERRTGAVHVLGTDVAVFLLLGSLIAPIRGRHALGMRLALAGNMMVAGAGFLGGHLALNRGAARRTTSSAAGAW